VGKIKKEMREEQKFSIDIEYIYWITDVNRVFWF